MEQNNSRITTSIPEVLCLWVNVLITIFIWNPPLRLLTCSHIRLAYVSKKLAVVILGLRGIRNWRMLGL